MILLYVFQGRPVSVLTNACGDFCFSYLGGTAKHLDNRGQFVEEVQQMRIAVINDNQRRGQERRHTVCAGRPGARDLQCGYDQMRRGTGVALHPHRSHDSHPAESQESGLCGRRMRHRAGYLNSAMQYPNVFCGLILDPLDAWLFTQINGRNCISLALKRGTAGPVT